MHLGIDIGGTCVKAALLDGAGRASTASSDSYARPDVTTLVAAIGQAWGQLRVGAAHEQIEGVGLAVPGLLDDARGEITASVNVPGLVALPLRELLARALGQTPPPLQFFTDAQAAGIDLLATQTPQPTGRLVAISLGTGVGMCVLDDGKALVLTGRSSGHLGQIDVTIQEPGREPPIGPDGGRGGLEAYIGLPALVARLGCTAETLAEKLSKDPVPLLALARALRIVHAIYRPQHIRLLGGVGIRLESFLGMLREHVSADLSSVARPGWTLACGTTPFHAALGAARGSAAAS